MKIALSMWPNLETNERYFKASELEQVRALFAEILPRDPARQIPGATDAGAADFVDHILAMPVEVYEEIPLWQTRYRQGLPELESNAKDLFGSSIIALSSVQRIDLITRLQAGQLKSFGTVPGTDVFTVALQKELFTTLRRHCIQGCFADPRWGGNKDRIIWKWFGYLQPAEDVVVAEGEL